MSPYAYVIQSAAVPPAMTSSIEYIAKRPGDVRTPTFADYAIAIRWIDRENDLKAIRSYRDDWDGMGASAPSPQLVDAAIRILKKIQYDGSLSAPSAVSGTPLGCITLEWRFSDGRYLEAELIDPQHIEWMEEAGGEIKEWPETIYDSSAAMFRTDTILGSESKDRMWSLRSKISVTDVEPSFVY